MSRFLRGRGDAALVTVRTRVIPPTSKTGERMIDLRTSCLRVSLDLDRGAELTHLGPGADDNVLAYYDWEAPLPTGRSTTYGNDHQDWLSSYRGGWQELFPNAGFGCQVDGVPLPFHGEVSLARWEIVDRSPAAITVRCPSRLPLVLERRIDLAADQPTMRIEETVTNVSDEPVAFRWGHHPAYESPPGTAIDLPDGLSVEVGQAADDAPDLPPAGFRGTWPDAVAVSGAPVDLSVVPDGPVAQICYLRGGANWYAVRPPTAPGVALAWDAETFPTLWFWQQIGGRGFPTYGRARITAIEPQSSSPGDGLAAAIDRGEALTLAPRGTRETWLTATLLPAGCGAVTGVDRDGLVSMES